MKEVLAAVGILAIVAVGYVVYKNKFEKHSDCGCGCDGDCSDKKDTPKTNVSMQVPNNQMYQQDCNSTGLGEGWIKTYDLHKEFENMTVNRA
jgi:hypothetical protein